MEKRRQTGFQSTGKQERRRDLEVDGKEVRHSKEREKEKFEEE